jgi:putative multiple sugar transport system substrate-binding protein
LAAVSLALALAACGGDSDVAAGDTTGVNANLGATIGIAMPTKKEKHWITDGANMAQQFKDMGYKTEVKFGDDDAKNQVAQIQAMIDSKVKLLVIGAVKADALTQVLSTAAKAKIPVIAYDRLIRDTPNVAYYASFDNFRIGELQGNLIVDRLKLARGDGPFTIELIAGPADDNNASLFYDGALKVLQPYFDSRRLVAKSGQLTLNEISTKGWDPTVATRRMKSILKANYATDRVDAVLSPNDAISIEIIKAFTASGYGTKSKPLPVISGQNADLNSMKSIIAGQQAGTIYKDTRELAKVAVQMSNALLTGTEPVTNDRSSYDNGLKVVPAYLLQPIAIDKANYQTLLVNSGFYTKADLG